MSRLTCTSRKWHTLGVHACLILQWKEPGNLPWRAISGIRQGCSRLDVAEGECRSRKSPSSTAWWLCIPQDVTFLTFPPAAVCKLLTVCHGKLLGWEMLHNIWFSSVWSSFHSGWHSHVLYTDLMLTGTAKSPSRASALPGIHLPSLCILGQKLCLSHLSAGFIWKQDARDLGHALLEKWRAPWEDYPADLFSLTCSAGTAALPPPQEAFPLKERTQCCSLNPTECKINPSAGEKREEIKCASFVDSFCRHLNTSCTPLSCLQLLPEVFCHSHICAGRSLSAVWRLGTCSSLRTVLDLRSFSFSCLLYNAVTIGKSKPPGWVSPALSCTSSTELGKFNQQLPRDSARV